MKLLLLLASICWAVPSYLPTDGKFFYMDIQHIKSSVIDSYIINMKGLGVDGVGDIEFDLLMTGNEQSIEIA